MKNKPITPGDVLRLLDGGKRYTVLRMTEHFHTSESNLRILLKKMQERGEVFRKAEHVEGSRGQRAVMLYFTSEPQPVGRPYHNMHLGETLTGWEASLRRHADLCMATRRAA